MYQDHLVTENVRLGHNISQCHVLVISLTIYFLGSVGSTELALICRMMSVAVGASGVLHYRDSMCPCTFKTPGHKSICGS